MTPCLLSGPEPDDSITGGGLVPPVSTKRDETSCLRDP